MGFLLSGVSASPSAPPPCCLSQINQIELEKKIELLYDPATALTGIYPKYTNMMIQRGTCFPSVYRRNVHNGLSV